jgi:hypothetical protein
VAQKLKVVGKGVKKKEEIVSDDFEENLRSEEEGEGQDDNGYIG